MIKNVLTVMVISAILCANVAYGASHDRAQQKNEKHQEIVQSIKELAEKDPGWSLVDYEMKESGVSFQKGLLTDIKLASKPAGEVDEFKLAGMYIFDASYAACFGRKKESIAALDALKKVLQRNGVVVSHSQNIVDLVTEGTTNEDHEEQLKRLTQLLKQIGQDNKELLTLGKMMDSIYGTFIKGLYVSSESIARSGYAPEMMKLATLNRYKLSIAKKYYVVFGKDMYSDMSDPLKQMEIFQKVLNAGDSFTKENVDAMRWLTRGHVKAIEANF